MDSRVDSAGSDIKDLTDAIAAMDDRLKQKEESLRTMFTRYISSGEYMKNFGHMAASFMLCRIESAGPSTKCSSMWK